MGSGGGEGDGEGEAGGGDRETQGGGESDDYLFILRSSFFVLFSSLSPFFYPSPLTPYLYLHR